MATTALAPGRAVSSSRPRGACAPGRMRRRSAPAPTALGRSDIPAVRARRRGQGRALWEALTSPRERDPHGDVSWPRPGPPPTWPGSRAYWRTPKHSGWRCTWAGPRVASRHWRWPWSGSPWPGSAAVAHITWGCSRSRCWRRCSVRPDCLRQDAVPQPWAVLGSRRPRHRGGRVPGRALPPAAPPPAPRGRVWAAVDAHQVPYWGRGKLDSTEYGFIPQA